MLRSLAHHRGGAAASGLVAFIGTVLVTAMAALLATGFSDTTHVADRSFLTQFPIILGGWVVAIVLFAMVSTVGVALAGRAGEIAGLRLVGATPRQVQTRIAGETLTVATIAAVPGLAVGLLTGAFVLDRMHDAGLIGSGTVYAPGAALPVIAALLVLVVSVVAAWIGSRTLAARSPVADPEPTALGGRGGDRFRRTAAVVLLIAGLGSSSAVLGMDADSILTTAMTGPAVVLVAVGLCMLATELLALANRLGRAGASAPGHVARINVSVVPRRIRPLVTFLTLFVGISAGTLAMQDVENRHAVPGGTAQLLAAINYLVVVLIAAFMAIALTNNLVASIGQRRTEFATMSLVGSTRAQTLRMLLREVGTGIAASVVAGTIGAMACVVPFAVAKTGSPAAAFAPLPYAAAVVVGAVIALLAAALAGKRVIRTAA
ncbi:FtsX-like permease family protein [Phytomonospora sp. NPDC050363]|uniref:FtsX-like permease family protein n=1 Tax=Phytomonospora sp. NPDC050363 TaxID=3155642 RepID=UPI0033E017AA